MIGLKRGKVRLCPHEAAWETEAARTVQVLSSLLGDVAVEMAHVGSTSIPTIMAKPIIDIAVAVEDFEPVLRMAERLREQGFYYRSDDSDDKSLLFAAGSYYDGTGEAQTHFVHVVKTGSEEYRNYLLFRSYLIRKPEVAREYEALKRRLADTVPEEGAREWYGDGKREFITYTLRKALVDSYLGKTVRIGIDRPIGYVHKKAKYTLVYPINYGYIPGVLGGDGEELDVYLLGVDTPVEEYVAQVIGIAHRENDVEDKLIACPVGARFNASEMARRIAFQEQYYRGYVESTDGEIFRLTE